MSDYDAEVVEFNIRCRMKRRWARQLISMLRYMQYLGGIGSSREVAIFADGDGDFRPTFTWSGAEIGQGNEKPHQEQDGNRFYDAG